MSDAVAPCLPNWVPEDIVRYLMHTECGVSIRQLAKQADCHPSTVLRQIRRLEEWRDDFLIDGAFRALATEVSGENATGAAGDFFAGDGELARNKERLLTVLAQPKAVLIVGAGFEKGAVLRGDADDQERDQISVEMSLAQILAVEGAIAGGGTGQILKYRITPEGRLALAKLAADREQLARVRSEGVSQSAIGAVLGLAQMQAARRAEQDAAGAGPRRARYGVQETPLQILSRFTNRDGDPFLTPEMVSAGERLREDYELAQIGVHLNREADQFREPGTAPEMGGQEMSRRALERVNKAMMALGPGLSDIAMRCCCHLEGLEAAEKDLGWSARSGKVVLRIALEQLQAHYGKQPTVLRMIG
ncbi:hypothetical protein TRM7557_03802 [Tritonibacter multivorans]|uniref:DUF6456 domain-containing protein n=1 Tax=Tritonibacter multivorans TaxID=928856 RepID=A0A0P1GJB1_9RHOB|nr:DUF6456 domain-containing protein [Tritonibacter multivorans]MDA7421551.1 DUF6456 domain-containing protein [Tritonibacter multivorans]CUH82191.1 hypothetical protein TRM7557_03802 [Tritonibacter multivorans]SFC95897.1 HTH domain-containing protein [Tritonibacter multivorans]